MTATQRFLTRLFILIAINIFARCWKEVNVIVNKARADAKDQSTKIKALGSIGIIQFWLELDGKAWNFRVGGFGHSIAARLTNGAWAFNKKTVAALYEAYDKMYPEHVKDNANCIYDYLAIAIGKLVMPEISLMDRIKGTKVLRSIVLGNDDVTDVSLFNVLLKLRYSGIKTIRGQYPGVISYSIDSEQTTGELGALIHLTMGEYFGTSEHNEASLKEDITAFFFGLLHRPVVE